MYASDKGIFLWQIADALGISEATLMRKLRKPLSDSEREKYLNTIEKLSSGGDTNI